MPKFETLFSKYDRLALFDTETTGLDPGVEYMTEIGGVIVRNGEVMEEFDTFVKPGKPITPKITEITGITNEPWHFRFVGREISMDMKDSGLCLEEYLAQVKK